MIAAVLVGSFAIYGYTASQPQGQMAPGPGRGPGSGDETGTMYPDSAARLSASDDITKNGIHQVSLEYVPRILIHVSHPWGGGKVTVPSDFISADFAIENGEPGTEPLTFRITSLTAEVKSLSYPRRVITGENTFQIVKEKSFVRVYGSSGTVKLSGEAVAMLTNRLFSPDNPATVSISFKGTYNFATRKATLTGVKAFARSPRPQRVGIEKSLLTLPILAFLRLIPFYG